MGDNDYEEFINQILRPNNYTTLKDPIGDVSIRIQVFSGKDTPSNEIIIDNLYPFQTIADLCTRIYIESGERDEYHPQNQCLLLPTDNSNNYLNFQYIFNKKNFMFKSPFTHMLGEPDSRFVDLTGNSKLVELTNKQHLLLETTLFKKKLPEYVLHLYLYRDVYQAYTGVKPVNRIDWEGMFRVYFPEYDKNYENGSLTPMAEEYKATLVKRLICRQQMIELIDTHLQETPLRKPGESSRGDSVNLSNIRNLRFFWKKISSVLYNPFDIESAFYDMKVSKDVPYIRFFPKTSTPLSKIHVEGPLNIPSIEVPELLFQWAEQKSMTPQENLIMLKVLLRPGSGSVNPLFATMYIHEDGSAKFIIQPDANTKALTRQGDLFALGKVLSAVSNLVPKLLPMDADLPLKSMYTPENIVLEDAYIVLSLWLEKDDTRSITKKTLSAVLPFYRPFFQISASPLEFQNPITFIRYKGVDNFQMPSRDFQFLHRVMDLQKLAGSTSIPQLVKYYTEEFDVPEEVSQARVKSFLDDLTRFDLTDSVVLDYKQATNPGIDIAFFGKHPFYTVHMYRVDSLNSLRRIKTLISLLVTLEKEEFEDIRKCYLTAEEQEKEEQTNADTSAIEESEQALDEEPVVAMASAAVDDTFAFDALGDLGGFGDEAAQEQEAAASPPLESLAVLDAPEVEVDVEEDSDDEDIKEASQLKQIKAKTYFSKRLDFYDQRLFQYAKGKSDITKYSSACAANALKQPVVMSEDEFARMKETYEEDVEAGKVLWIEYPIQKGQVLPSAMNSKTEIITTLRYGSNLLAGQANIYICCQYWCRKDDIVVLKSDFDAIVDRKGRRKDKGTCPFCRGGLVKDRLSVVAGETIIERITKSKSAQNKRHLFIRFLSKSYHPEGLFLPCCFIKDKKIFEDKEPAYASQKRASERMATGEPVVESLIHDLENDIDDAIQFPVDYKKKLGNNRNWYIVGSEKVPLEILKEGPQIGILAPEIDKFFAQDSRDLVINDHTVWKLVSYGGFPSKSGFLRIAVENRKRYQSESFLSAIAPFYGENSSAGIKRRIMEKIQPLQFLAINYGNFLFDFYNPTTPQPTGFTIKAFSLKRLLLQSGVGSHQEAIIRAWKGYTAFEIFMESKQTKEFRQFAQILSLPNLLYWEENKEILNNGIIFIILEVSGKGDVQLRCPPYGITPAMAARCDIGFIIHYQGGVWEPIVYTDNNAEDQTSNTYMVFRRDAQAGWPDIVKKRVAEYERMCFSSGLGIYTDSSQINSKTLLPLSIAMSIDAEVYAILRDSYNHVSSVLFSLPSGIAMVPVIDDGTIYPTTRVELDWRNFMKNLAPGSSVVEFYRKLMPILQTQPKEIMASYTITNIWRLDKSVPENSDIYALHLANGLIVPVKKPESGETVLESDFIEEGQEVPWMIDTKLVYGSKEISSSLEIDYKDFEEIFQHLRLTFSNWYSIQTAPWKTEINSILYKDGRSNNDLPLYEKRQRLFIKLGNEIMSWLDSSIPQRSRNPSLKRMDCRVIKNKDECSNKCVWREEASRCLLHVPEKYDIGNESVDAKGLMIKKLIDELIRFPQKREELLSKKVNKYIKLREAFLSDDQYIVPESSKDWAELMRMEWTKNTTEQPRYIEEYISIQPIEEAAEAAEVEQVVQAQPFPELLGFDAKQMKNLFYFPVESVLPVLETMGIPKAELEEIGQVLDSPVLIDQNIVHFVANRLKLSVYQIIYTEDNPIDPEKFITRVTYDKKNAQVIFIVQLDDLSVGMVSSASDRILPVNLATLPRKIIFDFMKAKDKIIL